MAFDLDKASISVLYLWGVYCYVASTLSSSLEGLLYITLLTLWFKLCERLVYINVII